MSNLETVEKPRFIVLCWRDHKTPCEKSKCCYDASCQAVFEYCMHACFEYWKYANSEEWKKIVKKAIREEKEKKKK